MTIHLLDDSCKRPVPYCRAKKWVSLSSEKRNVTCIRCVPVNPYSGSIVAKLISGKVAWCGGLGRLFG